MNPVREREAVESLPVQSGPGNTPGPRWMGRAAWAALAPAAVLVVASCSSESQQSPPPTSQTTVRTEPGVAGGEIDETRTATATVTDIDPTNRRVALTDPYGDHVTFTAGPEVRNFGQLRVGDKVNATFTRRVTIDVRSGGEQPGATYASQSTRAPLGDKPGALSSEDTTVVGRVMAIDPTAHTATIEFPGGTSRTIPVRRDVDVSRYRVGDNVVTRIRTTLKILVTSP